MNILLLTHEYPPIGGGGGNAARHLARCLQMLGIDVTILTSAFKGQPRDETVEGVRVTRVPALRRREAESSISSILAYAGSAFAKSLRLPRPDLVHAFFGVPGGAVGYALKQSLGLPYIVSFRGKDVHGGKSKDFGGITGALKMVSMPVWRAADALVANSEGLKEIAQKVDPEAVVDVIPNGVDSERFSPRRNPRPEGPIQILFVGRLEPYKGLDTLLAALAFVRQKATREFVIRIVGDGSLKAQLMTDAERFGVDGCVDFTGWVSPDEIPKIYQAADIFVLPSVVEGMPNGILESMATGLPSVASDVPGSEELIDNGKTGIIFPPGDVEALADALSSLVQDDASRTRMGQAARQSAARRSWDEVAERYVKIYNRTITAALPKSIGPMLNEGNTG